MIIMIDNYDSFTYNLVQYLEQIGTCVKVVRNDAASISELDSWSPTGIVISPGPGRPENAGISLPVVKHFSGKIPILGVCLGHQAIAACFGGKVVSAKKLMHGKTSMIHSDGTVCK
jgi:anthranilate synthase component 2